MTSSAEHWFILLADAFSVGIGLLACLELAWPAALPQLVKDALEFGKVRAANRSWTVVRLTEVPKRWFWHFYLAGLVSGGALLCATHCQFSGPPLAALNHVASDLLAIPDLSGLPWLSYTPIALQMCQMLRRMLECLLVSVYSPATMNLLHYSLGCSFYFSVVYSLLLRMPGYSISLARAAFFSATHALLAYSQFLVAGIFASSRQNREGSVIHYRHVIPQGHLFRYLSSPHYILEMLIYLNLFALTGGSAGGLYFHLLVFVLVNQAASALISHAWYRRQFGSKFPADRKALIPYVL